MKLNHYPKPEVRGLEPDDVQSILLDPTNTYKDFGEIDFNSC